MSERAGAQDLDDTKQGGLRAASSWLSGGEWRSRVRSGVKRKDAGLVFDRISGGEGLYDQKRSGLV